MKLHSPKNVLSYRYSQDEFKNRDLPFAPITYLRKSTEHGGGVELLIGYLENRAGVLIRDAEISEINNKNFVNSYKILYSGLTSYYEKTTRPTSESSIFRKPKIGDTLMCISKRYVGCEFGETYVLKEIREDRLVFSNINEFTYESEYFIVVGEAQDAANSYGKDGNIYLEFDYSNIDDEFRQRIIKDKNLIRRPTIEGGGEVFKRAYHPSKKMQIIKL